MKIGERFSPHPDFKKLYYSYLLIPSVLFFLLVVLPILMLASLYLGSLRALIVSAFILTPFILVVFFTSFWISRYCSSIYYIFTENEIVTEKGVWWRHKSTVPYNRITNIDVVQGPLSRRFGLGNVRIQTAGYSATGGYGKVSEASILGVKNFEEIRDFIVNIVRGLKPVAVEAGVEVAAPEDVHREILTELRKVREILEKKMK